MRAQYDEADPAWTVFCYRVLLPVFNNSDAVDYQTLAMVCGLESERQAANYLVTAKRCFVRCLRAVVGIYISEEAKPRYAAWADRSLQGLFQDRKPPVELLKTVKQTGQGWAMADGNNILAQVGATIYFISIVEC